MNRPVNEAQLAALRWVADGCPSNPDDVRFKLSAVALTNRRMVKIRRVGGWHATLTPLGEFYVTHGKYPPRGTSYLPPNPPRQVAQPHPMRPDPDLNSWIYTEPEQLLGDLRPWVVPLATQLRNPTPLVRALADHPPLLGLPAKHHVRGLRIVHTIIRDAEARGWIVKPLIAPNEGPPVGGRGRNLCSIEADGMRFEFRIRMLRKKNTMKKPAVSVEEIKRQVRLGRGTPRPDPQATDILRVELRRANRIFVKIQDTKSAGVHLRLVRLPYAIGMALAKAENEK